MNSRHTQGHIGISMSAAEETRREPGKARQLLLLPDQVNTTVMAAPRWWVAVLAAKSRAFLMRSI